MRILKATFSVKHDRIQQILVFHLLISGRKPIIINRITPFFSFVQKCHTLTLKVKHILVHFRFFIL